MAADAWDSAAGATNYPELIKEGGALIEGCSNFHPLVGTRRCSGGQHEWEVDVIPNGAGDAFVLLGVVAGAVGDLGEILIGGANRAGFYGFDTPSGDLHQGDAGPAVGELKTSGGRQPCIKQKGRNGGKHQI